MPNLTIPLQLHEAPSSAHLANPVPGNTVVSVPEDRINTDYCVRYLGSLSMSNNKHNVSQPSWLCAPRLLMRIRQIWVGSESCAQHSQDALGRGHKNGRCTHRNRSQHRTGALGTWGSSSKKVVQSVRIFRARYPFASAAVLMGAPTTPYCIVPDIFNNSTPFLQVAPSPPISPQFRQIQAFQVGMHGAKVQAMQKMKQKTCIRSGQGISAMVRWIFAFPRWICADPVSNRGECSCPIWTLCLSLC